MATREELKQVFANGQMATGEKFANLIDSMKVVQLPVVDPQALGTSLSFIDSISQDADGKITATKKTLDLAAHELNPFKGWYKTGDTLPTDGFDGAYLYFKDSTQIPAVTTIYQWNGTAYADTGTVVDTSNVQTFETGQAVNAVKIKDLNGDNDPDAAGVLSAEAGYTIRKHEMAYSDLIEQSPIIIHEPKNWLNMESPDLAPNYYLGPSSGELLSNTDYTVSGYTEVKYGETYKLVNFNAAGTTIALNMRFIHGLVEYDENKTKLRVLNQTSSGTSQYTPTDRSVKYIRFTSVKSNMVLGRTMCYYGSTPSSYSAYFEPYSEGGESSLKENTVTSRAIVNGSITFEKFADGIIISDIVLDTENNKLADARQINNLLDANEVRGKNLLFYGWEEKAYGATGGLAAGSSYHHMDVPCEPSTSYCLSVQGGGSGSAGNIGGGSRYVVLLDAAKNVLSVVGSTNRVRMVITTTADTAYIGVSAQKAAVNLQLEVGESRTNYEEPFEPYMEHKIKEVMLPPVNIPDGSITAEKLAAGISLPAPPNKFGRIYANNSELAANTLLIPNFIECFKNISIVANINSVFTEVQVGLGYHGFYGGSFKIDGTNIILVSGGTDTVKETLTHGLTLGDETTFIIDKGVNAAAKITLMNDQGDMYQHNISNFGGYQGRPFLRNNGSNAIDAELSFVPKDINQKIWMFGDSYFSYSGNNRWPYYLINNGYVSNLMISRGGDNATEALNSLTTLLGTGARPSYVLWFMGMNAGADTSSGPNATWLEKTQAMIALCSQYGITPVLSTIPTIPGSSHFYMNEWIRNSGYRYIDCAMAVEVSGSNYWKNWGETNAMLSSDEVHPTSYGAKALYSRVIADFPEITIEN